MSPLEMKIKLLLKSYNLSELLEILDIEEEDVVDLLLEYGQITKEDLDEL